MPETVVIGAGRLRCSWEVRAGVLPGTPMPEYTKQFHLGSDVYYREMEMSDEEFQKEFPDGMGSFKKLHKQAYDYATSLHDPRCVNWVDVTWIYY